VAAGTVNLTVIDCPGKTWWLASTKSIFTLCSPGGKPDALLHHSDRGSQYTSEQFQRLMADNGVVCSMSRSGNVWDNAAMESFFSSLKTERTARKLYRTRDDARADVFDYIERFYNPKRRHSTIGYMSPMEFERQAGLA
jgi:putative transposase